MEIPARVSPVYSTANNLVPSAEDASEIQPIPGRLLEIQRAPEFVRSVDGPSRDAIPACACYQPFTIS